MNPLAVTLFDDAPVYGGAERYLELLATGFDPARVAPRVVLAREPAIDPLASRLAARGIPVVRLPRVPTLSAAAAFARVLAHFVAHRAGVLHFNLVDPRACNGAIVAARLAGLRTIVATNQLPQSPFDTLPAPRRHRIAMAAIRHHIVVSEANRADLAGTGVDPGRITVIHNAAADPGPATPARRAAARAAMGAGSGVPLVGFSGRLAAQKNPTLFLESAAETSRTRPDVRFILIGDGPERAALEERARRLGLGDRAWFLGHREDAIELYAGLDILVFTSRYEGLPFTILEGMGLGIPVVAPRIPGIDEAVVDGVTGRLVGGDGKDAIAGAIVELLGDDVARASMGRAARARALEHFSVAQMVRKTAAVYDRVLAVR